MKNPLYFTLAALAVCFYPACEMHTVKQAEAMSVRKHVLHAIAEKEGGTHHDEEGHAKDDHAKDDHAKDDHAKDDHAKDDHASPTPEQAPRQAAPLFPPKPTSPEESSGEEGMD